ncbi:hypothetical protein [Caulobacter sp. NIBR2454]|uniref:hypothetical protein n=1 Tax=Caulobacter sp. NIBR2454 TaxID=3015996 RepID=UPI0022B5F317|nr:hypothetical protein [Caulobacter sp. NIBR2454]
MSPGHGRAATGLAAGFVALTVAASAAFGVAAASPPPPGSDPAGEDILALEPGLYVQLGQTCSSPVTHGKTYDGATLKAVHAGQCRSDLLWSLQGVQRLRQACRLEDGRWRETGRPYVRILDSARFEIVEMPAGADLRSPAGRKAVRYRHCPAAPH